MPQVYIIAANYGNNFNRGDFSAALAIPAYTTIPALSTITTSPRNGLIVVQTSDNTLQYYSNGVWYSASGTGTVTSVSSSDTSLATVATGTTTPVITIVAAPKLQTARTINGISFDGTGNITVTASAATLTTNTLNSTVLNSSLTSVGVIASGTWQGTAVADTYIASATTWNAKQSALTFTLGLTNTLGTVTNDLISPTAGSKTVYGTSDAGGNLTLSSTSNGTLGYIDANGFRIFPSGNIGINTTTDAGYKVDINGSFRANSSSGSSIITDKTSGAVNITSANNNSVSIRSDDNNGNVNINTYQGAIVTGRNITNSQWNNSLSVTHDAGSNVNISTYLSSNLLNVSTRIQHSASYPLAFILQGASSNTGGQRGGDVALVAGDGTTARGGDVYISGGAGDGARNGNIVLGIPYTIPTTTGVSSNVLIGTSTDNGADKLQVNGSVSASIFTTVPTTFAALPASPIMGMIAAISDGNAALWNVIATGGGTTPQLLWYNGTNWVVR